MSRAPSSAKIGKGMLIASWVLILGLLTVFFSDLLDQQNNPNSAPASQTNAQGAKEVRLQRNRYGHYVANGKINGHSVVFLLDTGATSVSIPETVARKIGLHRGREQRVSTANGSVTTYTAQLDSVSLGHISLHQINGHINPHSDEEEVLLGMSFLKHLEFTQRGDELILRQYQ